MGISDDAPGSVGVIFDHHAIIRTPIDLDDGNLKTMIQTIRFILVIIVGPDALDQVSTISLERLMIDSILSQPI
jgi:hypothetical protein